MGKASRMETVDGQIEFGPSEGGLAIWSDGALVATVVIDDEAPDDRPIEVSLPGGTSWFIESGVPGHLAALDDPNVLLWPNRVYTADAQVANIDTAVSLLTELPMSISVEEDGAVTQIVAGPSWRSWSFESDGRTLATLDTDRDFVFEGHHPVSLAAVVLGIVTAASVADLTVRPVMLRVRRWETKRMDKFLKKYSEAFESATNLSHDVQYMSMWDGNDLNPWIECLICGRFAATSDSVMNAVAASFTGGKGFGKLKGDLLEGACPRSRDIQNSA